MAMPTVIGRYKIEEEIGRGGMAIVYLARDPFMSRRVAIKVLLRHFALDAGFLQRFRREAQVIASLEHSAIVPIYDFGEHDGQPYIVMRYMPGGSLADRMKRGTLTLVEAVAVLNRLAPALDEAHEQGIIHRDLKPANILLDQHNQPYLCDFGLVKFSESSATPLTTSGGIVGTPAYMSPEQARGVVKLDGRTDVYALGVIFYELLTGTRPYKADTPMGTAMMHVLEPVPHILDRMPDLLPECDTIISKAMTKDREGRFPTASALAAATSKLTMVVTPPPAESPPGPEPRGREALPRWLYGLALLLAALVVLVLAGRYYFTSIAAGGAAATPLPIVTLSPAPSVEPIRTLTPTLTSTSTPTATLTPTSTPLPTLAPTDPPVFVPPDTATPLPPPPPTSIPVVPTNPPLPLPTNTPLPPPTNPPPPAPTNTPPPVPTNTPPG